MDPYNKLEDKSNSVTVVESTCVNVEHDCAQPKNNVSLLDFMEYLLHELVAAGAVLPPHKAKNTKLEMLLILYEFLYRYLRARYVSCVVRLSTRLFEY